MVSLNVFSTDISIYSTVLKIKRARKHNWNLFSIYAKECIDPKLSKLTGKMGHFV